MTPHESFSLKRASHPLTMEHFIAGPHPLLPSYLSLSILTVSVRQMVLWWLFNSRKETLLEGEFAIYFWRQKMKRGFSTLYLSCLFSSFSTHLCSLRHCVPLHPTWASMPSLCPRAEGQGEHG